MTILLFIGPSLAGTREPIPEGVILRPPAVGGDLLRAATDRPRAVALVDGLFGAAASVWHKEILAVLDSGIPVLGAASLGAKRAAELQPFGMEGVGTIFEDYAHQRLTRDDAVLVAHAPAALGWRPLSLALVDVVATLGSCELPQPAAQRLRRRAHRLHYADRTWPALLEALAGLPDADALGEQLHRSFWSRKARDVDMLLRRLRDPLSPRTLGVGQTLVRTGYFQRFHRQVLTRS